MFVFFAVAVAILSTTTLYVLGAIFILFVLFEFSWLIYGAVILSNSEACKMFNLPLWQAGMAPVILGFIVLFFQCCVGGSKSCDT